MIELLRPRCFLPVHGTLHHLLRHEKLARSLGVERTLVVENGTPVLFDGETLTPEPEVAHGKIPISLGGEPLDDETLQARTDLSRTGVALISLALLRDGSLAGPPRIVTRGVPAVDGELASQRALALELARAAASYRDGRGLSFEDFLRRIARRKLEDLSGTRPVVEISVLRLED
jgi:ribonuclease J